MQYLVHNMMKQRIHNLGSMGGGRARRLCSEGSSKTRSTRVDALVRRPHRVPRPKHREGGSTPHREQEHKPSDRHPPRPRRAQGYQPQEQPKRQQLQQQQQQPLRRTIAKARRPTTARRTAPRSMCLLRPNRANGGAVVPEVYWSRCYLSCIFLDDIDLHSQTSQVLVPYTHRRVTQRNHTNPSNAFPPGLATCGPPEAGQFDSVLDPISIMGPGMLPQRQAPLQQHMSRRVSICGASPTFASA